MIALEVGSNPSDQHGKKRDCGSDVDFRIKIPGFAVHLVIPDEEVNSKRDQRPYEPYEENVLLFSYTTFHCLLPTWVRTRTRRAPRWAMR